MCNAICPPFSRGGHNYVLAIQRPGRPSCFPIGPKFNETWQETRSQHPLPSLCIWADRKNRMVTLDSDWLRRVCLLWNPWTEFNEIWQVARYIYQVCVLEANQNNKMAALASEWLSQFRLLLWDHWTEFIETWQKARHQHPPLSLCFRADRKTKIAFQASDWMIHFRLLLWTEFNETWQDARPQVLYEVCVFGSMKIWTAKYDTSVQMDKWPSLGECHKLVVFVSISWWLIFWGETCCTWPVEHI